MYQFNFSKVNINPKQQDTLFFKRITGKKTQKTKEEKQTANLQTIPTYELQVSYHESNSKEIHLAETITREIAGKQKIAPGTKGNFQISLKASQDSKYYIQLQSQNEKPKNLIFWIAGKEKKVANIEELNQDLIGEINKNQKETISIHWEWKYENEKEGDKQDTKDAKLVGEYQFHIIARGEERRKQ